MYQIDVSSSTGQTNDQMKSEPSGRSMRSSTLNGDADLVDRGAVHGLVEVGAVDDLAVVLVQPPPDALDPQRRLAVVVAAERLGVEEREVGGVEEVVGEDRRAHPSGERTGEEDVVARIEVAGVVEDVVERVVAEAHPHQPEAHRHRAPCRRTPSAGSARRSDSAGINVVRPVASKR